MSRSKYLGLELAKVVARARIPDLSAAMSNVAKHDRVEMGCDDSKAEITFDGSSGRKPSTEARRYIYRCLAAMLSNDIDAGADYLYGDLMCESDRRRAKKAASAVCDELRKKASK